MEHERLPLNVIEPEVAEAIRRIAAVFQIEPEIGVPGTLAEHVVDLGLAG